MVREPGAAVLAVDDVDHAGNLDGVRGIPGHHEAHAVLKERVNVLLGPRGDLIEDPLPVPPVEHGPGGEAVAERDVQHAVGPVGQAVGLADGLDVGLYRVVEAARVGLLGDVADRAAHRAFPVERALRAFQYFDPLNVEQRSQRLREAAGGGVRDRHVVEIDADRGPAAVRRRGDAAHGQRVVGLRVAPVGEAGDGLIEGLDVLDALVDDVVVRDRGDRQGRVHQAGVAIRGGDHDLFDDAGCPFVVFLGQRRRRGQCDGGTGRQDTKRVRARCSPHLDALL